MVFLISLYPVIFGIHIWVTATKLRLPEAVMPTLAQRIWISHGLLLLAFLCQWDFRVHSPCPSFPLAGFWELMGYGVSGESGDIWMYLDIPAFLPVIFC